MRIVSIGDNCVDVYTNLNHLYPGGGAVNFAVHAARSGAAASYVGVVGNDRNGTLLREALIAEGVDTSHLRTANGPTAVAYVRLENGDRTFIGSNPGVRYQLAVDDAIRAHINGADLVHTTLDGRMEDEVPRWKAAGLRVSFDFSHRYTPEQLYLLPDLEIAFFSGQRMGPAGAEEAARAYHSLGARVVVITLGEGGSLAFDGSQIYRQGAEPTTAVDTLGAGDGYMAAFAVEYLRSGNIPAAMKAGTRTASGICQHHGAFERGIDLSN